MGKQDGDIDIPILIVFAVFGMILGGVIAYVCITIENDVPELGQSICEEEYGMDYSLYDGNTLYCKPAPTMEDYDGIKVRIKSDK